MEVPEEEGAV